MSARRIVLALLVPWSVAAAGEPLTPTQYAERYPLSTGDEGDQTAMGRCMEAWAPRHPFPPNGPFKARFIETKVRVAGIGSEVVDDAITKLPQLIYVKPAVNVMTKTTLELLNPSGWYCLEANVTVMGKMVIKAACGAKLADSRSGATVLGANDASGGVTVLGSTRITWVGDCAP